MTSFSLLTRNESVATFSEKKNIQIPLQIEQLVPIGQHLTLPYLPQISSRLP